MNRSDVLKQCEGLRAEILQVMRDIERLTKKPMHFAQDSVWASPAHEPYQNMPVPICGNVQKAAVQKELQERGGKYCDMLVELARKQNAAEDFLQTVPNAVDRVILRYRYIDGMEWNAIADKLDDGSTMDSVRMRAKRAMKKSL